MLLDILLLTLGTIIISTISLIYVYKQYSQNRAPPLKHRDNLRVAFAHPDLGIGGAERLVVDAALAFRSQGHYVHIYTSHHDPSHCFTETQDGTIPVTVRGDAMPRQIMGRLHAVFAYLRMCYVAMLLVFGLDGLETHPYDIIFCDQVSACIPILRLSESKILFYCHFPDKLLMTDRGSLLKQLYRYPIDALEEYTTGQAHTVVVNSEFTERTFREHFPSLAHVGVQVLYPSINFSAFDNPPPDTGEDAEVVSKAIPVTATNVLLSINRFENKKNVKLALQAFNDLRGMVSEDDWKTLHIVIAGGYDPRVQENVQNYERLTDYVTKEKLTDKVSFLRSFTDAQKIQLLQRCKCLLYTPDNEHFGICPVEAMYMERMVIAVASGGPLETVENNVTGCLCDVNPTDWARALQRTVLHGDTAIEMGRNGRKRVVDLFSFDAFTRQLIDTVNNML